MKSSMFHRRSHDIAQDNLSRPTMLGLGAAAIVLLGSVSWVVLSAQRPKAPGICGLAAVDVSGSDTPAERKHAMGPLEDSVDTALSYKTPYRIWQFDRSAREMYNGCPESAEDLWPAEDEICNYVSRTRGTYVDKALEQMLPVVKREASDGKAVAITVVWDGDCADPLAAKKAASDIAAQPNVRVVWLVGIKTDQGLRSDTERIFSVLGDRLIISGPLDSRDGLESFREKVGS